MLFIALRYGARFVTRALETGMGMKRSAPAPIMPRHTQGRMALLQMQRLKNTKRLKHNTCYMLTTLLLINNRLFAGVGTRAHDTCSGWGNSL